jgi:hypothetical protein
MCMSLPLEKDQNTIDIYANSSKKPPKLLEVISHVQLDGEHLKALAKYLLGRAKRKRVIQLPEEHRKAC